MVDHDNELYSAVAAQVEQLQGAQVSDETIETVLATLTQGAVKAISGAVFSCITLVERGEVVTIASTDPIAERLDELQAKHDVGPCLEAAWEQQLVRVDDYQSDERWPLFVSDVIAQTPVRASMSFQLHRDATSMSAFNVHAERPHAFDSDATALGKTFAAQAALPLHAGARATQFNEALSSRDDIGQAKGILMERYDITADESFEMLRKLSQDCNVKLVELARRLIAIDHPDAPNSN